MSKQNLYFIEKMGVYSHGVFWIGDDLDVGIRNADEFASTDKDDYHDWDLYKYKPLNPTRSDEGIHKYIYTGKRIEK